MQRLESTRQVHLSLAGSEFTLCMALARFGIPSAYITRVPDNPYGWLIRDTARSQGINTDHFVWAPKAEPVGRLLYELGRTPRKSVAYYQRMYSAASRLGAGMVDWAQRFAGLPSVPYFRDQLRAVNPQQVRSQLPAGSLPGGGRSQAGCAAWSGWTSTTAPPSGLPSSAGRR